MVDGWTGLDLLEKFYLTTGILSLLLGLLVAGLILFGMDGLSTHIESGHSAAGKRFRPVSIHTMAAFLLGFGWGGIVCLGIGLHPVLVVILSLGLGMTLMLLMYLLIITILGLNARNDLDISMAVGAIAEVYMTIPRNRSGKGRIRVRIGDEMVTMDAETNSPAAFKPGERVRVQERISGKRFLVREL